MSATDELRRMLDERGVAHSDHYLSTTWRDGHGILHLAGEPMADGSLVVDMLTPEQAIAATLGSDREAELQKALNKAAGNWARADADLRKALDFMRIWISEDAHLGESAISYKFERAEGLRRLAAIEGAIDAWNTRAERTCHIEMYPMGLHEEDGEAPICSACRVAIDEDVYYCPNCGARVVDE